MSAHFKKNITPDMTKVRIITIGDDPRLNTGFAVVHKNILKELKKDQRFQVVTVGWTPPRDSRSESKPMSDDGLVADNNTGFEIVDCAPYMIDEHGKNTFPKVAKVFKPNVVLSIGDPWMLNAVVPMKQKLPSLFNWIVYTPIDGINLSKEFASILDLADTLVTYGSWGKNIVQKALPEKYIDVVNHGVDTDIFFPLDKVECKRELGFDTDYLVGWIARNTPRKRVDIMLKSFAYFKSASLTCKKCGTIDFEVNDFGVDENSIFYRNQDKQPQQIKCEKCNENFIFNDRKITPKLYLHTPVNERSGFDISSIMESYGNLLLSSVILSETDRIGNGSTEDKLNKIYNACDVTCNTAEAEGWGLPIHESMACKTPVVAPYFGGYLDDLCVNFENSFLALPDCYNTDPGTGYTRIIPSVINTCLFLDLHYYLTNNNIKSFLEKWNIKDNYPDFYEIITSKEKPFDIKQITENAYNRAISLKWSELAKSFVDMINERTPKIQKEVLFSGIYATLQEIRKDKNIVLIFDDKIDTKNKRNYKNCLFKSLSEKLEDKDFITVFASYSNDGKDSFYFKSYKESEFSLRIIYNKDLVSYAEFINLFKPDYVLASNDTIELKMLVMSLQQKSIPLGLYVNTKDYIYNNDKFESMFSQNTRVEMSFQFKRNFLHNSDFVEASAYASDLFYSSAVNSQTMDFMLNSSTKANNWIVTPSVILKHNPLVVKDINKVKEKEKFITIISHNISSAIIAIDIIKNSNPEYVFVIYNLDNSKDSVTLWETMSVNLKGKINLVEHKYSEKDIKTFIYQNSKVIVIPHVGYGNISDLIYESSENGVPVITSATALDHIGMVSFGLYIQDCTLIKNWLFSIDSIINSRDVKIAMIKKGINCYEDHKDKDEKNMTEFVDSLKRRIKRCTVVS